MKMSLEREDLDEALANIGQARLSDREWSIYGPAAVGLYGQGPSDYDALAETISRARASLRPRREAAASVPEAPRAFAPGPSSPLAGPQWQSFRQQLEQRVFVGFAAQRQEVRRLLGLSAALPLNSAEDALALERFLSEVANKAPRRGDMLTLECPSGHQIKFWQGWHSPEDIGADHLVHGKTAWQATTCKGLAQLRSDARLIAAQTGCREAEAVAYLLCDYVPHLPLVAVAVERAELDYTPLRRLRHARYTITVNSHLVPPAEVAALYRRACGSDATRLTYSGFPEGREDEPLRSWTVELLQFVGQERRTISSGGRRLPWSRLVVLWNERYPQKPYKNAAAMRRSYQEATEPREDAWPLPDQRRLLIDPWETDRLRERTAAGESLTNVAREYGVPLAYLRDVLDADNANGTAAGADESPT